MAGVEGWCDNILNRVITEDLEEGSNTKPLPLTHTKDCLAIKNYHKASKLKHGGQKPRISKQ